MVESNYDILGVSTSASKQQIRIAFRELALKHHSDRGGHDDYFIKIKQAFEDLKTGKKFPDSSEEKEKKSKYLTMEIILEILLTLKMLLNVFID